MKSLHFRLIKLARLSIVVCVLCTGLDGILPAQTETNVKENAATMSQLLEVGWKASPENYLQAKLIAEDLIGKTPKPAPVHYAMSLVMLQQRKPAEAIEAVNEALTTEARDLNAQQFLIWLKLRGRDAKGAAAQMGKLAKVLQEKPFDKLSAAEQTEANAAIAFLGRAVSYLDGPLANSVPKESLDKFSARLKETVPRESFVQFETERKKLSLQLQELLDSQQSKRTAANKKHEEDFKEEIASNKEKLTTCEAKLKEIDSKVKSETAAYNTQVRPMEMELNQLNARYQAKNQELQNLESKSSDAKMEQRSKEKEGKSGPGDRDHYSGSIRQASQALDDINKVAAPKLAKYREIQAKHEQLMNELQNEVTQTQKDHVDLLRRQKELDKPYNGNTPEVLSLQAKFNAIDTFFEYPLQEEKARLSALSHTTASKAAK